MAGFSSHPTGKQAIPPTAPLGIPNESIQRIVDPAELKKNHYNISPSRYIHTGAAQTYRPISEIVEELKVIEVEARETDKASNEILEKLGI